MGGSDQWGNIVNGIDLTRRVLDREIWGLTSPLLTTSDGRKMGKSAGGATWLNGAMLSPYEFWQFWRNTTDADVARFLKLYTELPVAECDRLGALQGAAINDAKIILANEVTTLLHGADAAASAEATAREVFEQGGAGGDLELVAMPAAAFDGGLSVVQMLAQTGLTSSGKEAKRLIAEGGLRLNNDAVTDPQRLLTAAEVGDGMKISLGKKKHRMLRIAG